MAESYFAAYTIDTLAAELRGQLNLSADAPGGTVPARVTKAVQLAGINLYEKVDWEWRRVRGTLTLAITTEAQDAPNDFGKFDQRWLKENSTKGGLRIYSDAIRYQSAIDYYSSTATGEPAHLMATTESAAAPHKWEFVWKPICDAAYTYPIIYLRNNPWLRASSPLGNSAAPNWPNWMDEGWKRLALALIRQSYYPAQDLTKDARREFKDWLSDTQGNADETTAGGDDERIGAGYDDVNAFASTYMGFDGPASHSGTIANFWGDG